MRRQGGGGGGPRRHGGTAKLYRLNQTRKVGRRPDKRGAQLRRLRENKYKNSRRQATVKYNEKSGAVFQLSTRRSLCLA